MRKRLKSLLSRQLRAVDFRMEIRVERLGYRHCPTALFPSPGPRIRNSRRPGFRLCRLQSTRGHYQRSAAAFSSSIYQHTSHTRVTGAFLHPGKIFLILRFVLEELIDVLNGLNAEIVLGCLGEVRIIEFPSKSVRCSDHSAREIRKSGSLTTTTEF